MGNLWQKGKGREGNPPTHTHKLAPASLRSARLKLMRAEEVPRNLKSRKKNGKRKEDQQEMERERESKTMFQTGLVTSNEAAWALWSLSGFKAAGY